MLTFPQLCTELFFQFRESWTYPNCAGLDKSQSLKVAREIAKDFVNESIHFMETEESKSSVGLELFILEQKKKDLSVLVERRIILNHCS